MYQPMGGRNQQRSIFTYKKSPKYGNWYHNTLGYNTQVQIQQSSLPIQYMDSESTIEKYPKKYTWGDKMRSKIKIKLHVETIQLDMIGISYRVHFNIGLIKISLIMVEVKIVGGIRCQMNQKLVPCIQQHTRMVQQYQGDEISKGIQ